MPLVTLFEIRRCSIAINHSAVHCERRFICVYTVVHFTMKFHDFHYTTEEHAVADAIAYSLWEQKVLHSDKSFGSSLWEELPAWGLWRLLCHQYSIVSPTSHFSPTHIVICFSYLMKLDQQFFTLLEFQSLKNTENECIRSNKCHTEPNFDLIHH